MTNQLDCSICYKYDLMYVKFGPNSTYNLTIAYTNIYTVDN